MSPASRSSRSSWLLPAALLFIAVIVLYLPTRNYGFVNLDDADYVLHNKIVKGGLTWHGIKTAFTEPRDNFWFPVTWLSLMADVELFGVNPGAIHRTNFVLHAFGSLLFFLFLYRATGSPWKSFFAAALWALHPLRVESVAWITERKDTLSGFFFLLCLVFYQDHHLKGKKGWYIASVAAMFAGLASKPSVAVLPVVLMIADFWPLKVFDGLTFKNLLKSAAGKVPFFVLAAIFSVTTIISQNLSLPEGAVYPLSGKLIDTVTSFLYYPAKTLWPANLYVLPREDLFSLSGVQAVFGALLLAGITLLAWKGRKISLALPAGWLWYLVTLLPVSGIVPLGISPLADRYTYLPAMGLSMMAVWGIDGALAESNKLRRAAVVFCAAVLAALFVRSSFQISLWKDGVTLFKHAFERTGSLFAERALAGAHMNELNFEEAMRLFLDSLEKDPDDPDTYNDLGFLYSKMGKLKESEAAFKKAAELTGEDPSARYEENARIYLSEGFYDNALESAQKAIDMNPTNRNANLYLALAAVKKNDFALAEKHFKTLLELDPGNFRGRVEYGLMLSEKGDHEGALAEFREAVRASPESSEAHVNVGLELARTKRLKDAVGEFAEAARLNPSNKKALFYLALSASQTGQNELAIEQYKKYLALAPDDAVAHLNLGKVYAALGKRKEAAHHLGEAVRLNPGNGEAQSELERLK